MLLLPWWLRVGADGSREWTAAAGVAVPGGYEARAFDVLTDEAADDRARYAALSAPAHACLTTQAALVRRPARHSGRCR